MRGIHLAVAAVILLVAASCKAPRDAAADRTEIEGLYATWREAVEGSNIDGYVALLHPDVRLLPPGAPAIESAASYAEFLGPVFATATYRIDVLRMPVVDVRGDTAVAEYDYTIHLDLKNPDVGVTEPGALTASSTTARYFDVLLRGDDGWRVWRHSWQTYEPDAP